MLPARIYRTLLRLYPNDYRALFAAEMSRAFRQAAEERRRQCGPAFVGFLLSELAGLLIGASAEWISKWTTDRSVRGRSLPDLRMLRPPGVPREVWFAGACLSAPDTSLPEELIDARNRVSLLVQRMVYAIANHDFPGARRYSNEERQARAQLRRLEERCHIEHSRD
ncbi:MAG TPA: hypothetical protein VMH81_40270 [Bryobacteraceae bacterium]|nr:hypothetical protein [Bryobacteraceae bacterium]